MNIVKFRDKYLDLEHVQAAYIDTVRVYQGSGAAHTHEVHRLAVKMALQTEPLLIDIGLPQFDPPEPGKDPTKVLMADIYEAKTTWEREHAAFQRKAHADMALGEFLALWRERGFQPPSASRLDNPDYSPDGIKKRMRQLSPAWREKDSFELLTLEELKVLMIEAMGYGQTPGYVLLGEWREIAYEGGPRYVMYQNGEPCEFDMFWEGGVAIEPTMLCPVEMSNDFMAEAALTSIQRIVEAAKKADAKRIYLRTGLRISIRDTAPSESGKYLPRRVIFHTRVAFTSLP